MQKEKRLISLLPLLAAMALNLDVTAGVTVPYSCDFSESELAQWSIIDLDGDGISWGYGNSAYGGYGAASNYSTENDVNNVMISPAVTFESEKDYVLTFTAFTSYYERENLQVGIGSSTDPSTHTVLFDKEIKNYYGEKCEISLPKMSAGDYYISFRHYLAQSKGMIIVIKNLKIAEKEGGTVSGKVTVSGKPDNSGVKVYLKENPTAYTVVTDATGKFEFAKVPAGMYSVAAELHGYNADVQQAVVTNGNTSTVNITMNEMLKGTVSGTALHSNGTPVKSAQVILTGYDDYATTTDADGKFSFSGVTVAGNSTVYTLKIEKNLLTDYTSDCSLTESETNVTLPTITLKQSNIAPLKIESDGKGNVKWYRPAHLRELGYDNSIPGAALGYDTGSENNVVGSLFNYPITLHEFKYYSMYVPDIASALYVYVIEVGSDGLPTGNVLYSNVLPNLTDMWTQVTLPEPISCPYGCAIAIAGDGPVSIARDTNKDILPGKKSFFATYYSAPDSYRYFSEMDYAGALLIHPVGENIEENEETEIEYDVVRMNTQDSTEPDKWKVFPTSSGFTLTDDEWSSLPQGNYFYAVKVHYLIDNTTSGLTYSDAVEKDMRCDFTLSLTTNSGNAADVDGALFEVYKPGYDPHTATVENGTATITNLLKGNYSVRITKKGFEIYNTTVTLTDNTQSISAQLSQKLLPAANIDYIENSKTLAWDFFADIKENFDGDDFADFEINAPGENGWNYYDGDMLLSYGFTGISFPGMGSKMAAIIFNGKNTYPAMPQETAYSGERALGFFAAAATQSSDSEGDPDKHDTDDWFISPELDYHRDFKFSFQARSYTLIDDSYLESIRVGYSTTGMNPEDFTFITEDIAIPVDYTYYEYSIPQNAKYVAINYCTYDGFFLLVDDVALTTGIKHSGLGSSAGAFTGYRVTIDGKSTQVPANVTTFDVSSLDEGEHTASVVKLFASGESAPITLDFNVSAGLESIEMNDISIKASNGTIYVSGTNGENVSVFTPAGTLIYSGNGNVIPVASNGVFIVKAAGKIAKVVL